MTTIDFPNGPSINQQYTFGARTWVWDGYGWERLLNQGQTVSVFIPIIYIQSMVLAFPSPTASAWALLSGASFTNQIPVGAITMAGNAPTRIP